MQRKFTQWLMQPISGIFFATLETLRLPLKRFQDILKTAPIHGYRLTGEKFKILITSIQPQYQEKKCRWKSQNLRSAYGKRLNEKSSLTPSFHFLILPFSCRLSIGGIHESFLTFFDFNTKCNSL